MGFSVHLNVQLKFYNLPFTKDEKDNFVKEEPKSKSYFKEWYGAREFLNREPRYCLWLGSATPKELRSMRRL